MDASHIFPQGVLVSITFVGGGARDWGVRAGARCEVGLPLCSVAITTYSGWGLILSCWSRSPEGQAQASSLPFKCVCFPLFWHKDNFPRGGECWSKWRPWSDRDLMCCLCRHSWLCSDAASDASPLLVCMEVWAVVKQSPSEIWAASNALLE